MHSMSSIVIVLKSWVAGLFALLEQERHACALRLRHALGCSSPPSRSTTTSGDPFPPQSALRLISLAKASSVKRSPPTSSSGFTHEDVRKLEGVAFGKYEGSIRVIALRQLTLRLSDANILSTAEEDWVLRLARACLNTIDTVDWEAVNPFQTTDVELCVESANLLQTLVEEDKRLRLKLTLQRGPSPSDCHWLIPINTLLVPLLRDGAHVESPRVATKCVELDLILSIMAKTLFAWAVSSDNWELSIGYLPLLVRRKYSFPGGDSNCSSESAKYISCLETSFGVPTLSPGHLARDSPQWAHLFRRSTVLVHRTLESRVLDEQVANKLEFVLKNAGLQEDLPSGNRCDRFNSFRALYCIKITLDGMLSLSWSCTIFVRREATTSSEKPFYAVVSCCFVFPLAPLTLRRTLQSLSRGYYRCNYINGFNIAFSLLIFAVDCP